MRKNTLIVLAGLPGAGKSTFAKMLEETGWTVACPDRVRKMLYGDEKIQGDGNKVFNLAYEIATLAGQQKKDVVFDATSITRKARKQLLNATKGLFDFVLCYYFEPDLDVCLARNETRERQVPTAVICRMETQWETPTAEEGFDYVTRVETP